MGRGQRLLMRERERRRRRRREEEWWGRRTTKIWQRGWTDATTWSPPLIPPRPHRADRRGKATSSRKMRRQNIEWVDYCQLGFPVGAAG
ncbi:hypothetical protein BDW59DRAFT_143695 [Aspergillus cavernicola]|uniref:Uncharacterized protein n=1 Tax=Aspergillus cavernicola TaxID=176166 RepID=A0ABR4IJX0_9EURO